VGTANLTLAPAVHGSAFVGQILNLPAFVGSIQVTSTVPIVALSLNFEATSVFSSLPPGDLDSATPLAGER